MYFFYLTSVLHFPSVLLCSKCYLVFCVMISDPNSKFGFTCTHYGTRKSKEDHAFSTISRPRPANTAIMVTSISFVLVFLLSVIQLETYITVARKGLWTESI
jgi:hypothetical protein